MNSISSDDEEDVDENEPTATAMLTQDSEMSEIER